MHDILVAEGISKAYSSGSFGGGSKAPLALRPTSLTLERGKTLAVVGESGSGKSTLARCIAGVIRPTSGRVVLAGTEVDWAKNRDPDARRRVQFVFQDPAIALNPRMTVRRSLTEGVVNYGMVTSRTELDELAIELIRRVGLGEELLDRHPHGLSGGQRQRVAIARALSVNPDVVLFDESVSALDVSVQAQVLNLLLDLQASANAAFMFITHDLSVVRQIADDIMVLRAGQVVEQSTNEELFENPREEYTKALLQSIPRIPERR